MLLELKYDTAVAAHQIHLVGVDLRNDRMVS